MPLSIARIAELAGHLETAARERRAVPKLSDMEPHLTLTDAYEVQWSLRNRRLRTKQSQPTTRTSALLPTRASMRPTEASTAPPTVPQAPLPQRH